MLATKINPLLELVSIAERQVGVREDDGVNNTGTEVQMFQTATWLPPGAWPWCAAFCCWILKEWLKNPINYQSLGLHTSKEVEAWRCKDAKAFGWETWANKRGLTVLPETQLAKLGDFVIFDFSHIGIVVEDQKSIKSSIRTIEGNTNGAGDRESTTGDGVWRKTRIPSLTKSYIRIIT